MSAHRELALRRHDSPDLKLQWPRPGALRRSSQRMSEDKMLHPSVVHGRVGLVAFHNLALAHPVDDWFRFAVDLTIESFCDFFREIPAWATELGCDEFFITEELRDEILFDRTIGIYCERSARMELRERISDYIFNFGPLYTVRDYHIPRMVRLHRDAQGRPIASHMNKESAEVFKRFWPHTRRIRTEIMEDLSHNPTRPQEQIRDFSALARSPFGVFRADEPENLPLPGQKPRWRAAGTLMVRDENDLVVARLCGVI